MERKTLCCGAKEQIGLKLPLLQIEIGYGVSVCGVCASASALQAGQRPVSSMLCDVMVKPVSDKIWSSKS